MRVLSVLWCLALLLLGTLARNRRMEMVDDVDSGNDDTDWLNDDIKSIVNQNKDIGGLRLKDGQLTVDEKASQCPNDFIYNSTHQFCFKVGRDLKGSIIMGRRWCTKQAEGGRLVQTDTRGKFDAVADEVKRLGGVSRTAYLIGAIDKRRNQHFKWLTGERLKFSNWCKGSPNKRLPCIRLIQQHSDICMDDDCCYHSKYFICEKPLV